MRRTDTTCILAWLIEQDYKVICFMGEVGQEEDFAEAEKKAMKMGAEKFFLVVRLLCHSGYEDFDLLGTDPGSFVRR